MHFTIKLCFAYIYLLLLIVKQNLRLELYINGFKGYSRTSFDFKNAQKSVQDRIKHMHINNEMINDKTKRPHQKWSHIFKKRLVYFYLFYFLSDKILFILQNTHHKTVYSIYNIV
jgi:hypothetical protein